MHNPPKENRTGRLNLSLTETERRELSRLAADESARQGRIITVSEYVRLRTLSIPEQVAA